MKFLGFLCLSVGASCTDGLWAALKVLFTPQDFEALTPNLLARTVETVEGGGIVVILLRTMNSLKQLYTMTMVCSTQWGCSLPAAALR